MVTIIVKYCQMVTTEGFRVSNYVFLTVLIDCQSLVGKWAF